VKIEIGEFSALPTGLTGRAHIRAYARAVGLDPEEVLGALADRLPAVPDPTEALRARARQQFADNHPIAAACRERAADGLRRAVVLARTARRRRTPTALLWRYLPAAAVDGAILAICAGLMLIGSAWIVRTDVAGLWRGAWRPLIVSYAMMGLLYFTLSQSLARRTPGAVIVGSLARAIRRRYAAPRIARRHVWS
jgi:hypothetical protein